jgi:hypothetical protein
MTVLDGDPGLGKSLVTLDLAARISAGLPLPDGAASELPGAAGVVLVGVEDSLADTVVPRLKAAGADLSRIIALEGVPDIINGELRSRLPTLADLAALEEAIGKVGAALLVIDPLTAFLPNGTDSHNDAQVRAALSPLSPLAERTGCAILLVRHLNKTPGGSPLYRGGGSIAIIGVARSGMIAAADPNDPEGLRRAIAMSKSNLAGLAPSLLYRIEEAASGAAVVRWEGETNLTAAELLAPARQASPERQRIADLLENTEGPLDAPTIADRLGKTPASVRYLLSRMARDGQIRRAGTGEYEAPLRPLHAHNPRRPVGSQPDCKGCEEFEECEALTPRPTWRPECGCEPDAWTWCDAAGWRCGACTGGAD